MQHEYTNKVFKIGILSVIFPVIFLMVFAFMPSIAVAQTSTSDAESLKQARDSKARELEMLNEKIRQTTQNISALQGQSRTLANEVKKYDYSINQVSLSIRSSEVTLEKLTLDLEALDLDIKNTKESIESKKEAMAETLRILQKKDREGLLHIFLKNQSLVEGAFDVQAIRSVQDVLSANVDELEHLQDKLAASVVETQEKKDAILVENKNLKNRKFILSDQKEEKNQVLSTVKNKEDLFQQQLSELERQQNAISDEIAKIEENLRLRFDNSLLPTKRPGVFQWPVTLVSQGGSGRITQHAGERSYLYSGRPHNGLDIGAPTGTPIYAAEDGVVVASDYNGRNYQYGRYVMIKHNNNLSTLYAHMSQQTAFAGQSVKRGDIIGYVGSTGYSTGPHIHFGVYWTPSVIMKSIPPASGLVPVGVIIDPEDYL